MSPSTSKSLLAPRVVARVASVAAIFAVAAIAVGCSASAGTDDPAQSPNATDPGGGSGDDDGGEVEIMPTENGTQSGDGGTDARAEGGGGGGDAGPANPCPLLTFPSGVRIQSFLNAAMTATYKNHLATGETAPKCFLDTTNLIDTKTGVVQPISVMVGAHFALEELVGSEVAQGYGHIVVMTPAGVTALEKFRDTLDTPVSVISGFRSPKHQEDVCKSLCGNPLGCPGTCANNSRHMFGDAFDLPLEFYTSTDEQIACNSGFKFAYKESGTHLHVDINPQYKTCVIE